MVHNTTNVARRGGELHEYYEDGGSSTGTAQQKQAYTDWAEDWMKKLKTEFYDNANPLGRQGMYLRAG
eukprot:COSAG01_NODE_1833_length_9107_cov_7.147313_11_plen_68_part_00